MANNYKGLAFPFRFDSSGSTATTELTPDNLKMIEDSLYQLWFTRKREVVMEPELGSGAPFNFEAMDDITELSERRFEMMLAAELYEPRVEITSIEFEPHPDVESGILIVVDVRVIKFQVDATLTLEYIEPA